MTRILLVGYDPETVDFSDPALPPGMTAEKIRAGIAVALKQFAERGWEADVGFIRPDETAGPTVERQLASTSYDCVVIGAGVRLPPGALHYSKPSSTLFIGLPQARQLPSIHGPRIVPMLPPDTCRLEFGRQSRVSNKTRTRPRARHVYDRQFVVTGEPHHAGHADHLLQG